MYVYGVVLELDERRFLFKGGKYQIASSMVLIRDYHGVVV